MANTYDIGDVPRLRVTFRTTATNALVDPTTLTMKVQTPDGTIQPAQTWPGGSIVRESIGVFYYDFLITTAGRHKWEFLGVGLGAAKAQAYFDVRDNLVA